MDGVFFLYIWQRREKGVQVAKVKCLSCIACLARRRPYRKLPQTCGSKATCRWWRNLRAECFADPLNVASSSDPSIHSIAVR